ncbi:MAG: family N-acetyltransferase [Rhodoglobus sp.]|nr:family N-acetyltransferase [Rhodoglobus sp.]
MPVSDVPWHDVRTVFGTRGDPARCWCQYFILSNREWNETSAADKERMLCGRIEENRSAPGVLAYLDGEPVGWCAIEPRTDYRRILTSRVVTGSVEPPDDARVWAVTCFVVRVGFRRQGVAGALLEAAVAHARKHGARDIEGYPVDTAEKKASSAELYHGALSLFLGAGFHVVSRPAAGRAVVSLSVE